MADVGKVAVQERYGSGWSRPTRECPPTWKNNNPHTRLEADYQHHLNPVKSLEKQLHEREAKRAAITAFHQYRTVRTLQSATRPKPGEPSLTMPPSTPAEQSLSRSTTDESVVRLHPLAPGAYDLGLLYLRSQSALTPIIMYAIQVYRRYPPHNWNQ